MESAADIWLSRNGQKWGPYTEQAVRQWLAEGKFLADMLAWRNGASEWVPLASLLSTGSAQVPPPFPGVKPVVAPPPTAPPPHATFNEARSAPSEPSPAIQDTDDKRTMFPRPPTLHWFLVVVFTVLTLGIFGYIWPLIQASWVKKIDKYSNATLLLCGWVVCAISAVVLAFIPVVREVPSLGMSATSLLLNLTGAILFIVAIFSMAGSVRREMPKYGAPVAIGGITLFFFSYLYFQGQLRWLSRWRDGDRSQGAPPKAIFWVLGSMVFVGAMAIAIAVASYQSYVERSEALAASVVAKDAGTGDAIGYTTSPESNSAGQSVVGMDPSVLAAEDSAGQAADTAEEAADAADLAYDTGDATTDPTLQPPEDPYAAYRAEQEAKRNEELMAARARAEWVDDCGSKSRKLTTPAGSEIGLSLQEATQYCECLHNAQSGDGNAELAQGNCLDRLM